MKGAIIYKTKYGATKQYAEWLGAELSLPIIESDDLIEGELKHYDFLLLGTPVYIGKFKIAKWLKRNVKNLIKKKVFLFVVAGTSVEETETRSQIILDNVPQEIKPYCEIYFLKGRVKHSSLSFSDRLLLKMAAAFEKDPAKKRVYIEDMDGVKRESLEAILSAVKNYSGKLIASTNSLPI